MHKIFNKILIIEFQRKKQILIQRWKSYKHSYLHREITHICYFKICSALKCLDHIGVILYHFLHLFFFCYIEKNKVYTPILTMMMDCVYTILRITAVKNQGQLCKPSLKGIYLMKSNFTSGHNVRYFFDCKFFRTAYVHPKLHRRDSSCGRWEGIHYI